LDDLFWTCLLPAAGGWKFDDLFWICLLPAAGSWKLDDLFWICLLPAAGKGPSIYHVVYLLVVS